MDKKKVKEIYNKKILLINKLNKFYYDKNNSVLSDGEYDILKREIIELENKYEFLKSKNSPSKNIGYKPSKNFEKVAHRAPMLSLANAFSEDDLINFEKKIFNFLSLDHNHKLLYSAEPKIDGISASITYRNGVLFKGLSRGDGKRGKTLL